MDVQKLALIGDLVCRHGGDDPEVPARMAMVCSAWRNFIALEGGGSFSHVEKMNRAYLRQRFSGCDQPDRVVEGLIRLKPKGWTINRLSSEIRGGYWKPALPNEKPWSEGEWAAMARRDEAAVVAVLFVATLGGAGSMWVTGKMNLAALRRGVIGAGVAAMWALGIAGYRELSLSTKLTSRDGCNRAFPLVVHPLCYRPLVLPHIVHPLPSSTRFNRSCRRWAGHASPRNGRGDGLGV